jgi:hypothetical protein
MKKRILLAPVVIALLAAFSLSARSQTADDTAKTPADRARVFITDSQSWEVGSHSGGGGGAFASEGHGGARPQTAEIIKTFGERCPDVMTNNIQTKVDYIVLLDHEGGKGLLSHKNKVAVFARVSGDSVVSKSTLSLGGSVQTACEAIRADWAKNATVIRAAAAAEAAAMAKPAIAATPQMMQVAASSAIKISVNSTPAGADIEVDGGFVGNTPSSIEVPAGEHTITVSKNGFKNWERKLKASGGNVNLNVELESK